MLSIIDISSRVVILQFWTIQRSNHNENIYFVLKFLSGDVDDDCAETFPLCGTLWEFALAATPLG